MGGGGVRAAWILLDKLKKKLLLKWFTHWLPDLGGRRKKKTPSTMILRNAENANVFLRKTEYKGGGGVR